MTTHSKKVWIKIMSYIYILKTYSINTTIQNVFGDIHHTPVEKH